MKTPPLICLALIAALALAPDQAHAQAGTAVATTGSSATANSHVNACSSRICASLQRPGR